MAADKKAVSKAQKTAKKVTATEQMRKRKVRTNVHFFRPKTLTQSRAPKAPKKSVNTQNKMDKYRILKAPVTTEAAMKKIEEINTLVFVCDLQANKRQIRKSIEDLYEVKCASVRTLITPRGQKRAYVRLTSDFDALDVANKIGVI